MKKIFLITMIGVLLMNASLGVASDASDIITLLEETYGVDLDMKEIQTQLQDLDTKQLDAIIGHYGYGDLLNSDDDLKDREWSPDSWDEALQGLSGGNNERYEQLVNEYKAAHPSLSDEDMKKGSSSAYSTDYQQQVQTNQAANVHASYSFEEVNKHLDNIKTLSDQIEKSDNQKSIADLNARINTEIAYLQVEQIKATSVMNEQLAQEQASSIVSQTEASKFNQIPDK